jgi:small-conductance mechanosensitive channel
MSLPAFPEVLEILQRNPYLHRFVILVSYIALMKVADIFIDRILRKLTARTSMSMDDELLDFLHGPICWTIFWLGVIHALLVGELIEPWQTVLPSLAKTMILVIWTYTATRVFNWITHRKLGAQAEHEKIGKDVILLMKNVIRIVIIATGVLWLLTIWKIDMTPLFASAGIAGIAVALAAKDTLANFFGGISVFMDKTFKLGDYIVLDSGERGEVMEIGIRSTRIKTRDDIMITIPNSLIANSKIINESAPVPRFRIRVPLGVAYGSDLDLVEQVLLAVALANPEVSEEPEARVRMRAFGDSSIDFELLCWVDDPSRKGLVIHNILKAINLAFKENDITIPFPQRDVHLIRPVQAVPGETL